MAFRQSRTGKARPGARPLAGRAAGDGRLWIGARSDGDARADGDRSGAADRRLANDLRRRGVPRQRTIADLSRTEYSDCSGSHGIEHANYDGSGNDDSCPPDE